MPPPSCTLAPVLPPSGGRWLILPMEIVERELAGKLLLASEALRYGFKCVIGTKRSVFDAASHLPTGVMMLKSIIPSEIDTMRRLKAAGHTLVCLDEEGLIQTDLHRMARLRFSDDTVQETDLILCWGQKQQDVLRKAFPAFAPRFQATGSPRADLWKPRFHAFYQKDVDALRHRFGEYIFLPSSFGWPNHHMGPQGALDILRQDKMVRDDKDLEYFQCYQAYTTAVFESFLAGLPALSRTFPDTTIIIRPHPSERHETWHNAAKGLENVKVVYEGTVAPWLLAARVILHCGSTTGVEAHLMGRPVISWDPAPEAESRLHALELPRSVSINVRTLEDLLEALRKALSPDGEAFGLQDPGVQKGHKALGQWIEGMDEGNARSAILELLNVHFSNSTRRIIPSRSPDPLVDSPPFLSALREVSWRTLETFFEIGFFREYLPERLRKGLAARAYGRQKTRDINSEALREAFDILSVLNQSPPGILKSLGKNLFCLEART